ncbi:hypothetical protein FIBSPDRAFT_871212 [Athelia psychrophila]|uniref:Uncharacterized protein n=1 Tax=Athelia psychrophila TaxID=1759441 RepID=A0A166AIA0_9AGAM|nr:hypothetical protein FIBSPDRAFT_871212 [Fibularhizoctonia sp. CBS 109695]
MRLRASSCSNSHISSLPFKPLTLLFAATLSVDLNAPPILLLTYIHTLFTFIPTYLFPSFSQTHTTPRYTQDQRRVVGAAFLSLRARHTSRRTHQPHADPTPSITSQPRSHDSSHAPWSAMLLPRQHDRTSPTPMRPPAPIFSSV